MHNHEEELCNPLLEINENYWKTVAHDATHNNMYSRL